MGFLSGLFGNKISTEEMIKKTSFFLSPQIQLLEKNSEGYEHRLGQKGVYYILCLAEAIAKRQIDDNELMALLLNAFGQSKAISINNHFLMTKRHIDAHTDLKNKMKPIAVKDIENGIINSSNYLITQNQLAIESTEKMFE